MIVATHYSLIDKQMPILKCCKKLSNYALLQIKEGVKKEKKLKENLSLLLPHGLWII